MYRNNSDGTFSTVYSTISFETGYAYAANWGDYDNDGWIDVFIPLIGTNNQLYRNNNGSFVKITNEIIGNEGGYSVGGSWGDYDNNGKLDLFVTNTSTPGVNYFYKNIGQTGNYVICRLSGCQSNKAAIGARIKIKSGNLTQIREVTSGNASGNMLWQHFGLGSNTIIDSLIVYWPFGATPRLQILTNVSVNQTISISECTIGIISNELPVKYELKQNYPNPFNPVSQIEYSLLKSTMVKLTVYDLTGKIVRNLVSEHQSQGTYRYEFDGTGYASGTYFYKLETETFTSLKKMVLLK